MHQGIMRRRAFLRGAGSAAVTWPMRAWAQKGTKPPLVAMLMPFTEDIAAERTVALRLGLEQAGLVEGGDYALAIRFANGDWSRLPELVKELAVLKPRVFVIAA